jgi:SAM-dependent methyltransferase
MCASEQYSFAPPTQGHDYSFAGAQRISLFAGSLRKLNTLRPQTKSLLDVGAAYGHMVHLARSQGLRADGIELSDHAVQQAQDIYGITLFKCTLSEFTADALYDVIHLSHVFEHFVDPLIELSHLKRLLAPGGLIYIEVPFQFNLIERVLSFLPRTRVPFTLHSIHHPYFYTPPSIRKFFVDNGFEVLRLTLFDSMRYECDTLVKRIKCQIWRLLSFFGTGNYIEIIVIPRKGEA